MSEQTPAKPELEETLGTAREQHKYDELIAAVPYARYLGVEVEDAEDGGLLFKLPFRDTLVGNMRISALHGGVIAGFMENAALLELMLMTAEQKHVPKPVDFSIDYLRSAGAKTSYARCDMLRQGRRVCLVQIKCWQDNPERPVAWARVHFLLDSNAARPAEPEDAS